jgi:hypothetical protein
MLTDTAVGSQHGRRLPQGQRRRFRDPREVAQPMSETTFATIHHTSRTAMDERVVMAQR